MGLEAIAIAVIAIVGFAFEGWAFYGDHLWHEKPERDPRNFGPPR